MPTALTFPTRREVLDSGPRTPGYVVQFTSTRSLDLISFDRASGSGYAISRVSGLVYRVVKTGRPSGSVPRMCRVAVFAAVDNEDAEGTLSFPTKTGGGFVSNEVV